MKYVRSQLWLAYTTTLGVTEPTTPTKPRTMNKGYKGITIWRREEENIREGKEIAETIQKLETANGQDIQRHSKAGESRRRIQESMTQK